MGQAPATLETADRMTGAAAAFLATLRPEQRERATFDFESEERYNWHYTPRPRKGLARGDMNGPQLEGAEALMAQSLGEPGFAKASAIIRHELILARIERSEGVTRFDRDPGLYFFSVFGTPGGDAPWGWRVDGHHLSLNLTAVGGDIASVTPSFFGANPAEVKSGPEKGLRILQEEEDLGRGLYLSLEPERRSKAEIYPVAPPDLITRASRRVEIAKPAGLSAELMSAAQRRSLMSLLKVYIDREPPHVAAQALKRVEEEGVGDIHFGWAGSQHRNQPHYYRIHGPSIFVEYDNTQNMANHIHSVWRDIEGDFGFDVLRAHYERHHA